MGWVPSNKILCKNSRHGRMFMKKMYYNLLLMMVFTSNDIFTFGWYLVGDNYHSLLLMIR
jgi:hypothetical protein